MDFETDFVLFFFDFEAYVEEAKVPKVTPKSIPKPKNRILVPPGRPRVLQGAILDRFCIDFGGILRPLGSILVPFWGYRGSKRRNLQHISENSSKQQQTARKKLKIAPKSTKS